MGPFEDKLLRESVDLVVPENRHVEHIHAVAPATPLLLYTNTSSLYLELLTDWLSYADDNGLSREAAFYHAARATPFRGDSPSSRPVAWFWGVYRGGQGLTDLTNAAHARPAQRLAFGGAGEALYVGYPDRFREVNVELAAPAGAGWSAALEYATAVDGTGRPTAWAALKPLADTTAGLKASGQVTFAPPAGWKSALVGGSARLFYVRFRTASGGQPPVAGSILGRDYVGARGKTEGVVPAFDSSADANGDGYLDDAEYARRAAGKDARFLYESRMPCESYGQMRFCTNPSPPEFRKWAVDYQARYSKSNPAAAGLFMDNSEGRPSVRAADVRERLDSFGPDYGAMLKAISTAIAPRWILANTAGGGAQAHPVIRQNPAYLEEFAIRPLYHNFEQFEDLAAEVARRAALTVPPPYAVLDSHPQRGDPAEPRTQLATLAYYYLLADPDSTFLMFYGGFEPSSPWQRHWTAAAAYDVGRPAGAWSRLVEGDDPSSPERKYRVYRRAYAKALVLYKPLSFKRGDWRTQASLGDETATRHDLGGTYRPLRADGALGEPVTSVTLRNGEGAILVKAGR
jgi:hypothetical protein